MQYEKVSFLHFFHTYIKQRGLYISKFDRFFYIRWYWLTTFPFGNKDRTAPGLSIYLKLPPRRCHFSSWLSSNESLVKWSEHTLIALDKTGLAIALIEAFLISFLSWPGILRYETFLFNLDWFEEPFSIFVSSKVITWI